MISRLKIAVLGVLETRIKEENMEEIWANLSLPIWGLVHNYSNSNLGRIWVLFDTSKVNLTAVDCSVQFIHYKIVWCTDIFYWTCVYGSYDPYLRRSLARLGKDLDGPWLIQGDFSAICSNKDRKRGVLVNQEATNEPQEWILGLDLLEVPSTSPKFTWTNFQEGDRRIYKTLDWHFANYLWYNKLGEPCCSVLNSGVFDHCSLLVDINGLGRRVKAPFRFFNM